MTDYTPRAEQVERMGDEMDRARWLAGEIDQSEAGWRLSIAAIKAGMEEIASRQFKVFMAMVGVLAATTASAVMLAIQIATG